MSMATMVKIRLKARIDVDQAYNGRRCNNRAFSLPLDEYVHE